MRLYKVPERSPKMIDDASGVIRGRYRCSRGDVILNGSRGIRWPPVRLLGSGGTRETFIEHKFRGER